MRCRSMERSVGSPCASRTTWACQSLSNKDCTDLLYSVIRVAHIGDFSYGLANQFANLARRREITTGAVGDVGRAITGFEHVFDREFDVTRFLLELCRMAQHPRARGDRAARVRDVLAGNIRRRTVDRFV